MKSIILTGEELQKRTRQMVSGACVVANKINNDRITKLTREKQDVVNEVWLHKGLYKDPIKAMEYENKCEELHKKIYEDSSDTPSIYQIYDRNDMFNKAKLPNKARNTIKNKIGEKCLKEGKIVPGMKVSFK